MSKINDKQTLTCSDARIRNMMRVRLTQTHESPDRFQLSRSQSEAVLNFKFNFFRGYRGRIGPMVN